MEWFISEEQLKKFAILFDASDRDKNWLPLAGKTWRPFADLLTALTRIPAGTKVRDFDWSSM